MTQQAPKFIIISGTSGSGKTIALQVLEDLGYYCVDNLPASLMAEMAERALGSGSKSQNIAISIDARNQDFLGDLNNSIEELRELALDFNVVFLDSQDSTLLTRFSETRRKHPLSDSLTSLSEAIVKERALLSPILNIADQNIDTSHTTPHELRSIIRNQVATIGSQALTLQFQSFGFKYGTPTDVDFIFDVRCLPNPYWQDELRTLNGFDQAIVDFLAGNPLCEEMFCHIRDFINHWLPHFKEDNRNYITVAIGCTGGRHRSVYLSNRLSDYFKQHKPNTLTQVRHRELSL